MATDLVLTGHFDTWDGGVIRSTDVAGITYHAPSGHLYLADSEIDELGVFNGENIFEVSLSGDQEFRGIESGNSEPTGITYNEFDGYFYVTNDNTRKINRYNSQLNQSLASVTTTNAVSSADDPEGITSDPATGLLYVADGTGGGRQVLIYNSSLKYQGRFSVSAQLDDPEGIAFDPVSRHLFIVSTPDLAVAEYTVSGTFVKKYDISGFFPTPIAPQGLTFAPTSDPTDNPGAWALYIADGMIDNHADGRVYEAILIGSGQNAAPQTNAGLDQTVLISTSAILNGTVTDDGLPNPPGAVSTLWNQVSGPGTTTFSNVAAVDTTASFSQTGTYVLRLTANDGALSSSDQVTVTVVANQVPSSGPVTISFQDGVAGYLGTRDTTIYKDNPTTNYGSNTWLEMDGKPDIATLIAWNISAIAAGSTVRSASITLNVTNPSNDSYEFYQLKRNWLEGQATWQQFVSGSSWQTEGAQGSNDVGSASVGQLKSSSTGVRTINLNAAGVSLVQSWVDAPGTNQGIIIKDYSGPTNGLHLDSRGASTAALRPKLTIVYEPVGVQTSVAPQANLKSAQMPLAPEGPMLNGSVSDNGVSNPQSAASTTRIAVSGPATQPKVNGGQAIASLSRRITSAIPAGSTARSSSLAVKVSNPSNKSFEIYAWAPNLPQGEAAWQELVLGASASPKAPRTPLTSSRPR